MIETHELEAKAKKAGFEGVYAWFCGLKGSDAYACTPKIVSTFDDLTGLQTDTAITQLMALFLGTNADAVLDMAAPAYMGLRVPLARCIGQYFSSDDDLSVDHPAYTDAQKAILCGQDDQFIVKAREMSCRDLLRLDTGDAAPNDPTGRSTNVFYEELAAFFVGIKAAELRVWPIYPYLSAIRAAHLAFFMSGWIGTD